MKYCPHCGTAVEDNASVCFSCGSLIEVPPAQAPAAVTNTAQKGSFGFWILGFFVPVLGVILWAVMKNDQPGKARSAGFGALFGFLAPFAVSIFLSIITILFQQRLI